MGVARARAAAALNECHSSTWSGHPSHPSRASEQEEEREDSISTRFMVGDLSAYCKGQYATRSKNTTRSPSPNRASPLRRFSEKQRTTTLPRPQRQRVGLFCGLGGYHAHVALFAVVSTGCTARLQGARVAGGRGGRPHDILCVDVVPV